MITTTQIERTKQASKVLRSDVLGILNWSEQQYAEFKFQQGITYLHRYVPSHEKMFGLLMQSRMFWNWWKNCWDLRDEVFMESFNSAIPQMISQRRLEYIYKGLHDARRLVLEIKPAKSVLIASLEGK
jgi:hypothetical protein